MSFGFDPYGTRNSWTRGRVSIGQQIDEARAEAKRLDDQLARAPRNSAEADDLRHAILTAPASIFYSVINANRKLKPHRRASELRCLEIAADLNLFGAIPEKPRLLPRLKKGGQLDVIFDFGLRYRAAQDLVARILQREIRPRPFQFGNKGVHAAVARVKQRILAGHVHASRMDVDSYFASFELDRLALELPLPWEVVAYVVVGRHMKVEWNQGTWKAHAGSHPMPHTQHLLTLARRGIPAGSGCSSIVADYMMSKLPWPASLSSEVFNYVDDFLLLADSEMKLNIRKEQLHDAIGNLRGGRFHLEVIEEGDALEGFEFLGHRFKLKDGMLHTTVSPKVAALFAKHLVELDAKFMRALGVGPITNAKQQKAVRTLAERHAIISGWQHAFSQADDVERHVGWARSQLQADMATIGVSFEQVCSAADGSIRFKATEYLLAASGDHHG